ncbi:3-hydroxyacyl-CoA dehydrogenase [Sphingomonas sp. C8-2]|jgi:3-hydroxyacyl-CoA dehydrogenase|nr:3-hydroxyacyl-CoA dehydrogenase [Sphingomonas sp. C8-2]
MAVSATLRGTILEIMVDNPPVNALGHAIRKSLLEALEAGARQPEVEAIVIACAGRTFFAGADISEFGKPPLDPILPDLCNAIEALGTPVVAAIHGTALGGGLEVALACHYRVAVPSARLGLPEVKLGLIPGAGGTQRLPRLVGIAAATDMILSGDPIPAGKAAELGLIDHVAAEGSLIEEAHRWAQSIADQRPLPRTGERSTAGNAAAIDRYAQAHARKLRGQTAPQACFEALRAAIDLPLAEGLATERRLFRQLVDGDQSAALRHYFFAERKAARIDGLDASIEPLPIETVGVIGAGTMGAGIAMAFLSKGLRVVLLETSAEALDRGLAHIRQTFETGVAKGRMVQDDCDQALARLSTALDYAALGSCDLIIEAVFELMTVKREVFARIDAVARPGAILATNTSYLDIDEIAAATGRPEYVVGLHFFSPANIMKLLEVVRATRTSSRVLATAMALAKRIGKIAVVAGNGYGFIGNRLLARRRSEAYELLLEGVTPWDIDEAHVGFGMPMGPFRMSDLAGVDIGWHRDPTRVENVRDALCAAGRLGQKVGRGYYDYDEKRQAAPSAEALAIIDAFARSQGRARRDVPRDDILERTLYAMVDEGARLLGEGIAQRASDIDVVWVNGYGWPSYLGGPMHWAERTGLARIVERLRVHGMPVAPLLAEKASRGERFDDPQAA